MPKPDELTTAAALRAKATKALDTMRARIVKADEARTEAAHQTRAAPVTSHAASRRSCWLPFPPRIRTATRGTRTDSRQDAARWPLSRSMPLRPCPAGGAPSRSPLSRALIPIRQLSVSGRGITPTTNRRNDMATNNPDQPVAEVRLGRITATIWRNRTADDDGVFYSTQITRLYRRDEKWERSHAFGRDDLLTVAKVADMANTCIHDLQAEARATGAADADPEGNPGHDQDA